MQSLPKIQQLLADWYLQTLETPFYAGAIAISIWLLMAFFYSIKIYFLNKTQHITEQAKVELQNQLVEKNKQHEQSETKLAEVTEQLSREQLLATEFSLRVEERNQQIIDNIKYLADKFDLSEQLLSKDEDHKAEFVWQQHDNIQTQLTERLQTEKQEKEKLEAVYQQEKAYVVEKSQLIGELQEKLDLENTRASTLEQDLGVQKEAHQQQKQEADGIVAELLAKHKLDVEALNKKVEFAQSEKVIDEPVAPIVAQDLKNLFSPGAKQVEDSVVDTPVEEAIEETVAVVIEKVAEPIVETVDSGPDLEEVVEDIVENILDAQFEVFEEEPVEVEPTVVSVVEPVIQPEVLKPLVEPEVVSAVELDYSGTKPDLSKKLKGFFSKGKKPAVVEASVEPKPKVAGKLKGLLSKAKKKTAEPKLAVVIEEVVAAAKVAESKVEDVVANVTELVEEAVESVDIDYGESKLDVSGKLKGLWGKGKKQVAKAEPAVVEEVVAAVSVVESKVEELAANVTEAVEEAVESVDIDYGESKLDVSGKLKGLWGKGKKQAAKAEPAAVVGEVVAAVNVAESKVEEVVANVTEAVESVDIDYGKSKLDVSGKLKGLWGKGKKQATKVEPKQAVEKVVATAVPKVATPEQEHQAELLRAAARKAEHEEEFEPDYSGSDVHFFDSMKGFFSKK